jgi:hypothetical protein
MTTSTTHANRAVRISIIMTGRHIQNAKFANFHDYRSVAAWLYLFSLYITKHYVSSLLLDIASQ